jgi:tetrahydromethanopterin S-methyltransferase subunit B
LLNTSGDRKLKLCEDVKKGVVCQNLEEITVLNVGDIFEILQKGTNDDLITVVSYPFRMSNCDLISFPCTNDRNPTKTNR